MRPKTVFISSDLDIVTARTTVREVARGLGFGSIDLARVATAVSELALNIFLFAGTGQLRCAPSRGRGASRTSTW